MRMRAGLLTISSALACGVLATESTQKPEDRTTPSNQNEPVASWSIVGPIEGQLIQGATKNEEVEDAGVENRIVFSSVDDRSPSMEEMRKRLADPEQREAMRAEQRASLDQFYSDLEAELNLGSRTREALVELLTNQYLESLDAMFGSGVELRRREAWPSIQSLAAAENRKLDQLREVLGEDGLERYQEYTATMHERGQVREIDAHLGAADKLSPEQKGRLVKLFREKNQLDLSPPVQSRMSNLMRSRDPGSPTFREDLQRESQLATIESNQQILWRKETSNRWMAERASAFLRTPQKAALAKTMDADIARQRKWIAQARAKAGLDPAIPEHQNEEGAPVVKPASGEVTLDLIVRVNGGEPVHVVHTGRNGEPLKFKASEDLFVEAEWTLFDDNWIDVRLTYFEEGPNGRRRLQGGSGFGTMGNISGETAPSDNSIGARGSSSTIVTGRKAYSVELSASAAAR